MAAIAAAAALIVAIAGGGIYLLSGDSAGNAVPSNPPEHGGTTPEKEIAPSPKPEPAPSDPNASLPRPTDPTTKPPVSSDPAPSKTTTPASTGPKSAAPNQPPGNPRTGRNESGCQSLEDSARARPEVHAAQFELGRCYYDASRFDEAIAAISRAVDINSRVPEYLRIRGLAKWKNGLGRQGLADLDNAVSLDVMNATLYKSRGDIHAGVGDYQRAVDDFRKATELAPQDSGAWFGLADALTRNGDREAGEVAMRQAKSRQ
jgi:Flp pilus assembly protein TadD